MYSQDNVFARILRKEIPCDFLIETAHTVAFYDQFPTAPVHVLIIPKGPYTDAFDFYHHASEAEILDFSQALSQLILQLKLDVGGFKLVSNAKTFGKQEVPHFHVHLLGEKAES
jgi:histidine triad (HIT) family protein